MLVGIGRVGVVRAEARPRHEKIDGVSRLILPVQTKALRRLCTHVHADQRMEEFRLLIGGAWR
jgi:hypothetical protein